MKKTLKEIHEYWDSNSYPETYRKEVERSIYLFSFIEKYIKSHHNIMEIGCNVGRNLEYLHQKGFNQLTGIELSHHAVQELKRNFPKLADEADIIQSPVENVIKHLATDHYDLVFTMAVLEHIHPDSEWIFQEIARVTKSYLITFEAEQADKWRIFPRNYRDIFESLGYKQIEESSGSQLKLANYTLRIFKKKRGWFR
ncbi:class I SAM-dependent methyltransferase [Gracilibacillus massiliensis]|uniref:class I SAM-dependent methyltransferase n=1 Tax=Gracilibacillus massiliensis TaxID=1564956 RepID=UPI00071E49F4|nr:class I SAM-dependent methyltransferase [Gracilibacillus massiliensis]